jgi:hypothetical protein
MGSKSGLSPMCNCAAHLSGTCNTNRQHALDQATEVGSFLRLLSRAHSRLVEPPDADKSHDASGSRFVVSCECDSL